MNTIPTILSVDAVLVDLPTIRAHKLAMTTMMQQTLVIVRVACSDEITGVGETTTVRPSKTNAFMFGRCDSSRSHSQRPRRHTNHGVV